MSKAFDESQKFLSEMKTLQKSLPPFVPSEIAEQVMKEAVPGPIQRADGKLDGGDGIQFIHKSPTWKILHSMTLIDYQIVATYENIFEDILNVLDPQRLAMIVKRGERPNAKGPGISPYAGPDGTGLIWHETMADALKAGLISQDEARELDLRRCWDKESFTVDAVVRELAMDIRLFDQLNRRLGDTVSTRGTCDA